MKKIDKWWIWAIGALFFLIIVQILFSIPAPCKYLDAVWEAGDLISFAGTIVLGFVAIHQTQQANEMSKRLMEIENNRYMLEMRPFFMVTDWKAYELDYDKYFISPDKLYIQIGDCKNCEKALGIGLKLHNTTNSYMTAEYFYDGTVPWKNITTNQPNRKIRLYADESKEIVFFADPEYMKSFEKQWITVKFILENRFAQRYQESFCLLINVLSKDCLHNEGEWYCDVIVQSFKIGKFEKNSRGKIELIMED